MLSSISDQDKKVEVQQQQQMNGFSRLVVHHLAMKPVSVKRCEYGKTPECKDGDMGDVRQTPPTSGIHTCENPGLAEAGIERASLDCREGGHSDHYSNATPDRAHVFVEERRDVDVISRAGDVTHWSSSEAGEDDCGVAEVGELSSSRRKETPRSDGNMLIAVVVVVVAVLWQRVAAFNLDTSYPLVRTSQQRGSYYGYTVALRDLGAGEQRLVVSSHRISHATSKITIVGAEYEGGKINYAPLPPPNETAQSLFSQMELLARWRQPISSVHIRRTLHPSLRVQDASHPITTHPLRGPGGQSPVCPRFLIVAPDSRWHHLPPCTPIGSYSLIDTHPTLLCAPYPEDLTLKSRTQTIPPAPTHKPVFMKKASSSPKTRLCTLPPLQYSESIFFYVLAPLLRLAGPSPPRALLGYERSFLSGQSDGLSREVEVDFDLSWAISPLLYQSLMLATATYTIGLGGRSSLVPPPPAALPNFTPRCTLPWLQLTATKHCALRPVSSRLFLPYKKIRKSTTISPYTRQKARSKYRNRIRLERASQKQFSDTHKTPYDRVKRCRERKINIKASERVNVDGVRMRGNLHRKAAFTIQRCDESRQASANQSLDASVEHRERCTSDERSQMAARSVLPAAGVRPSLYCEDANIARHRRRVSDATRRTATLHCEYRLTVFVHRDALIGREIVKGVLAQLKNNAKRKYGEECDGGTVDVKREGLEYNGITKVETINVEINECENNGNAELSKANRDVDLDQPECLLWKRLEYDDSGARGSWLWTPHTPAAILNDGCGGSLAELHAMSIRSTILEVVLTSKMALLPCKIVTNSLPIKMADNALPRKIAAIKLAAPILSTRMSMAAIMTGGLGMVSQGAAAAILNDVISYKFAQKTTKWSPVVALLAAIKPAMAILAASMPMMRLLDGRMAAGHMFQRVPLNTTMAASVLPRKLVILSSKMAANVELPVLQLGISLTNGISKTMPHDGSKRALPQPRHCRYPDCWLGDLAIYFGEGGDFVLPSLIYRCTTSGKRESVTCCRLVIGAPRGNSSYPNHAKLEEPGVVYQCDMYGGPCQQLALDLSGKRCSVAEQCPPCCPHARTWEGNPVCFGWRNCVADTAPAVFEVTQLPARDLAERDATERRLSQSS
ncbi:hypothetical protein PR048_018324 [Dryococelus australis]|uniref:Uncharacterized protein n=1 Tax=Dryococelus australis TaxID=614101 RepID=A0ABQ9HC13_9NEOP|nr:hypothetical protein PR048_018324 [Dryococelus australis]